MLVFEVLSLTVGKHCQNTSKNYFGQTNGKRFCLFRRKLEDSKLEMFEEFHWLAYFSMNPVLKQIIRCKLQIELQRKRQPIINE